MINLAEILVFVTAAEEMSFSKAAIKLHLSQSAVSQNIQSLERNYGVELFLRMGRSIQLTQEGINILPAARDLLRTARACEDVILNSKNELVGNIKIASATTSGNYFIPNILAAFQKIHPKVKTVVTSQARQIVQEGLIQQNIDLGVIGREVIHKDLESFLIVEDKVVLIVPDGHPWTKREQISHEELYTQAFIRRMKNTATNEVLYASLKEYGIDPSRFNIVSQLEDAEAVLMAVENGIGITFISEMMASRSLALGKVKMVNLAGVKIAQPIYLVRHIGRTNTLATKRLWDFIRENRDALIHEMIHHLSQL